MTITMDRPRSSTRVRESHYRHCTGLTRAEFMASRRDALGKQMSLAQERLDSLRHDIRKIRAEVDTGKREVTQDLLAKLERLRVSEQRLIADQIRIERKIRAAV